MTANDESSPTATPMDTEQHPPADPPLTLPPKDQWKLVQPKSGQAPPRVANKQHLLGVRIELTTSGAKNPGFNPKDIPYIFECIASVDPTALIVEANSDPSTAKPVKYYYTATSIDYQKTCDMSTTHWGKPSDNKVKTFMSFYIASDVIKPGLAALHNAPKMMDFQQACGFKLQAHRLRESRSRALGYFFAKDPRHTYRDDLRQRMQQHLREHSASKSPIPVQVLTLSVKAKAHSTRMLTILVGSKDLAQATSILEQHPFPAIEIVLHKWNKTNPEEFQQRLHQHDAIISQCRAFKITGMHYQSLMHMRQQLLADFAMRAIIVDIPTASHYTTTGTCYVQYLYAHQDAVLKWIQEFLTQHKPNPQAYPNTSWPAGPALASGGSSIAMTKQSNSTSPNSAAPAPMPTTRFLVPLASPLAAGGPPTPAVITFSSPPRALNPQAKSYSAALRCAASTTSQATNQASATNHTHSGSSGDVSSLEEGSVATKVTENKSIRSAQEIQLAQDNAELQQQLLELQTTKSSEVQELRQQLAAQAQQMAAQAQQINVLLQQMEKLSLHFQQNQPASPTQDSQAPSVTDTRGPDATPPAASAGLLGSNFTAEALEHTEPKPIADAADPYENWLATSLSHSESPQKTTVKKKHAALTPAKATQETTPSNRPSKKAHTTDSLPTSPEEFHSPMNLFGETPTDPEPQDPAPSQSTGGGQAP